MRGRTGLGGLAMAMTIGMTPMPAAALDTVEAKPLTLERLFADPSLDGASPRAVRPSPDGRLVAYLQSRADDAKRRDLWLVGRDGRQDWKGGGKGTSVLVRGDWCGGLIIKNKITPPEERAG